MKTWLFQANPDRYDIMAVLKAGELINEWSITHHLHDVSPGDRAVLWIGGRKAPGVYGVGVVTGEPFTAVIDDPHWRDVEDQVAPMVRCPVRFDTVLLDEPILKDELKADPRFAGSRIITQPFAGNPFLLTDMEWQAIADRLSLDPSGPVVRSSANVWLEVQHRAREWMAAGTPVYTLKRGVRNVITGVTDTKVERRSDEPRGGGDAPATRRKVEELWDALVRDGHTRNVPSPLYFAHALLQRAIPGIGYEEHPSLSLVLTDAEEANRAFDPAAQEVPGLTTVPPPQAGGGRGSGGGEGEIHAALKAKVKDDPVTAVGEALTYISEDLTDRLGDEISFITGDRVDLLMKDEAGNYIVIEVEPVIGPTDHIGFHQAAKYWVLIAVAKGIDLERVRRMVVATTIDATLRDHYHDRYGIEWIEVSLP